MNSPELYRPPSDLRSLGNPLSGPEMPKLLFRFPGPCGLFDLSHGLMHRLAPPEVSYTHFGAHEHLEFSAGIHCFGSLAIFNPATFQIVQLVDDQVLFALGFTQADRGRIYLGVNRPVAADDYAWVPSETYFTRAELKDCNSSSDVRELVGPTYGEQLDTMFTSVRNYMEEMSEVLRAELPRPAGSWYSIPPEVRRQLLSAHGVTSRWS